MAAEHTPGPFAIEAPIDGSLMIVEAGKPVHEWRPVAVLPLADERGAIPNSQVLANAHLFAEAPALLAQLKFAVKLLRPWAGKTAQVAAMEKTIARAEGQAQ